MATSRAGTFCVAVAAAITTAAVGRSQQWGTLSGSASISWDGVFDARRQRFVQLVVANGDQGVWEWSGQAWRHLVTGTPPFGAPVSRTAFATANDPWNGRAYVFGGRAVSTLADFWYFDGLDWTQVSAALPPPRRTNAAMAYDTTRRRLVLYGGEDGNQQLNDVWEYDGTSWAQLGPGPTWVANTRAVYDAARGVVLWLGLNTYSWNGAAWNIFAADPATPTSRLAYDPVRRRVVLYRNDTVPELRELNNGWATVLQAGVPRLSTPTLWFDDTAGKITIASPTLGGKRLLWDGVTLQPSTGYAQGFGATWFFDPVRARGVLFGGNRPLLEVDETWTWDGTQWTEMQPATRPPGRRNAASTFDTARGVGLLYGGFRSAVGQLGDLWAWNGSNWSLLAASGPPPTHYASMTFDSVRGRAVLFGGIPPGGGFNLRVWEWDGTSWNQMPATGGPTFGLGTMAFDPVRARTVLELGLLSPAETWEWDGTQWTRIVTPQVPPQVAFPSANWDPQRQRIVLAGNPAGFGLWEYDGVTWTKRTGIGDYAVTFPVMAVYDSNRQRLSLFDGACVLEPQTAASAVDAYGTTCGSPPAVLMTRGLSRLGNATFGFDLAVAPNAVVALGLSGSQASAPVGGGCTLLVGPLFDTRIGFADGRGFAAFAMPVPADNALLGITVYAQGGGFDSSGALLLSQGLRIVVGE